MTNSTSAKASMANGWRTVPFSEVVKVVSRPETLDRDKTYRILGMRWYAQGLFIREDKPGHEIQANELFRVEKDDFVYNRLFAWKGSFGIVDDTTAGGYVSGEFPCFHVITEKADPKFIHLYLSQEPIWNEIARVSSGQTNISRLRLKVPTFLAMEIPLPPLTEQTRIMRRIEALAARLAEARSLRREADVETVLFINSVLNALVVDAQKKYKTLLLENLLKDANYGTSVKCHPERTDDAVPVLRIPNVASEKVTLNDLKFGVLGETEYQKTVLQEGDILVVRTNGSADLVGRCAVVPALPEPMAFASYMIRIRCDKEVISPAFLQLVLRQQRTGGFLIDFARTTAGQYNVSLGRLRKTKIPVPPLEEQWRLVTYLDALQAHASALRAAQAETGKMLSALMPSILDKAFKGEL
jgi:type I restriction enzyme S subunit